MPVKIHLTEEAREGFELAQPREYYGVKLLVGLWCVCLAVLHAKRRKRQFVFFTVPSTFVYLFNHGLTQIKINISALRTQYGIQAFAKFKRPECIRFHLRELQSQKCSRRSMRPKRPRKVRRSQF